MFIALCFYVCFHKICYILYIFTLKTIYSILHTSSVVHIKSTENVETIRGLLQ